MSGLVEALFIYDEHNRPILTHVYTSRPLTASQILPLYLAHLEPRPSLIYLPNTSPPTLVFSLEHANLLFLLTSSSEIEPLLALEFLHRVIDVLEEFIGSPLLSGKVENSYDVVAQLLSEMCDAGAISTTEPNALRDLVEVEGLIGKLLGGINIPGKSGFHPPPNSTMSAISSVGTLATITPSLPWRRANVRHTSNELYVDLVETLTVTLAPSGRPLAAVANGTIAFTCKISGVPDILLNLSTPSGRQNIGGVMELPVFHPCVRLTKWREKPGELSFIPPDGRFVLAGYEVNLSPFQDGKLGNASASNLKLPVGVEVKTCLGQMGSDFEVRLFITKVSGQGNPSHPGSSTRGSSRPGPRGITGNSHPGNSTNPILEELIIRVPLPSEVRNLLEIRASRGDTVYSPGGSQIEWHIPAKEAIVGVVTLRCTVMGATVENEASVGNGFSLDAGSYDGTPYQGSPTGRGQVDQADQQVDAKKLAQNKLLMPSSATVSFSVKGWLASGVKVESVVIDTRKSRGLSESVKPYKGVKYLTVSKSGIEVRC